MLPLTILYLAVTVDKNNYKIIIMAIDNLSGVSGKKKKSVVIVGGGAAGMVCVGS